MSKKIREMPSTFLRILKELSLEDLQELREWNRVDSGFNRHANAAIDKEIAFRNQILNGGIAGVWNGEPTTA